MNKDLFRDHLRDYVKTELGTPFDSLIDKQRSIAMARFFADRVLRPLYPGLLPEDEEDLAQCSIDGANDCGVDFFAKQGNNVLIIQAKYSSGKKVGKKAIEKAESFESFCEVLSRLKAGPKKFNMNQRLKEALVDIDWDKDNFSLYYITLHQPAANSWPRAEKGVSSLTDVPDLSERATLELLDEGKLNINLRDALKHEQEFSEPITILCSDNNGEPGWLCFDDEESGRQSYILRLNGGQVAELYKKYRSRLFTLNIRNYIGDTTTNRAIRRTAISLPEAFFYFNNGICAVATKITPEEKPGGAHTFTCERFSIINGAQTVRSLSKAQAEDADSVRKAQVLLRIVQYGPKINQPEQEFLDNIIRYNNTQNSIKLSDFRSNDPIQFSIKSHFSKLPALKGRKFLYKNKRMAEMDGGYIGVGMEEFTKSMHAFLFGPDDMFGGSHYLFDTGKDGGYSKLFGDESEIKGTITDDSFEQFAGIWFLCESVKKDWKALLAEERVDALERRWIVYFTVGESLRIVYRRLGLNLKEDLQKLANPNWSLDKDAKPEHTRKVVAAHFSLAIETLKKIYAHAMKEMDFTHRNWFRDEHTLDAIRSELESVAKFTTKMPQEYVLSKGT